ncbi:NitT/TauT family transport system substrate-binding protein [Amycolatopsis sacchari]|uniref:NitT/TauT family transport system substrate-binding protein n=1 Tax=Amycolatopsis sacchari TaxID=115433 RepID=A0A1I3X165_9PSEU|nr:ABC transporter substrate-binding protein [Amycolatopsis sacchari]SFK13478.1 NitT/TauT family transport system substrate-binding protein [Amycolatopsis sacchari]
MGFKRITGIVLALVLVLAGATACRDSRTLSTGADGTPKIRIMVGGIEKVIYLPAMLTQQLGGFAAQGVDVELLNQPSGANAETALLAGDVQGVVGFYDHTIDLQAKEQCITSVVQMANIPGEAEVVSTAKADQIRDAGDFRGRKLGITSLGSSTDFLTKALAGKASVTAQDYTPVKVGAGQTFIAALNNGGIDAGMTTDPTIAQLVNTGQGKVIYDLRTEEGTRAALGGLYPATSLYMNCEIVQRYPAVVQKLANAFVSTLRWIDTHSPEEIAAKMPASFAGGDPALYVKSIRDSIGMFNADGRMDPAGAQNALQVLESFSKNVKNHKDRIDLSKTYTTAFADAAKAQLG